MLVDELLFGVVAIPVVDLDALVGVVGRLHRGGLEEVGGEDVVLLAEIARLAHPRTGRSLLDDQGMTAGIGDVEVGGAAEVQAEKHALSLCGGVAVLDHIGGGTHPFGAVG